jgi:hypothetical protein
MYEVAPMSVVPPRSAPSRELVGNTALNMAVNTSLEVPAGETRCYVIRYGNDLVFDLAFEPGWNLVSLPIEPICPAVDSVLAAADPVRGRIYTGEVLTWTGQGYEAVSELHACIGYWVYVTEPHVVLVPGLPSRQSQMLLRKGWNQCGVEAECHVPDDARLLGPLWVWNPLQSRYEAAGVLRPGLGYWVRASADASVSLDMK